jgi:hypothetical protein
LSKLSWMQVLAWVSEAIMAVMEVIKDPVRVIKTILVSA